MVPGWPQHTDPSTTVHELSREDRASGTPTGELCGQAHNKRRMDPTPDPDHSVSVSARLSTSRRNMLQVQVGCSQPSPLQEQVPQGEATRAQEARSKESPIGGGAG